ncbi:MAG: Zn-dependent hydrolase [Elainellaceae cyanobacterium]
MPFAEADITQLPSSMAALTVNGPRLMQAIADVGAIGALPDGGVGRLAFSAEDCQARDVVAGWMSAAGMAVTIDAAGNVIGRYPGRRPQSAALATGSHLDTVPKAGLYDGAYGVLAGLEVVRTLHDRNLQLDHPIEVIVFADEERTMIGSKAMVGRASSDPAHYDHPRYAPIQPSIAAIGGSWDQLSTAQRHPGSLAAFVELHVEQGPVLEAEGVAVGLVTGIVGQRRFLVTVTGQASHAGTTPMDMRQDALVAAAEVVLAVHRIGCLCDELVSGDQVATVGSMTLSPNVANTIPGQVQMTVDMRDMSNESLDRMAAMLEDEAGAIAAATQTRIQITAQLRNEPVPVSPHIYNAIAQVCQDLDLDAVPLPSRASHDAQIVASLADMGMIFVPSQGGISHAETEYTTPEHCVAGANMLLHTLMRLDQHYRTEGSPAADNGMSGNSVSDNSQASPSAVTTNSHGG